MANQNVSGIWPLLIHFHCNHLYPSYMTSLRLLQHLSKQSPCFCLRLPLQSILIHQPGWACYKLNQTMQFLYWNPSSGFPFYPEEKRKSSKLTTRPYMTWTSLTFWHHWLLHSLPVTLASLLFLEHVRQTSTSGSLQLFFLLFGKLFSHIDT